MQTEIEGGAGMTHYAAWLKDGHPRSGASASKPSLRQRDGDRLVYKAVQAHGPWGIRGRRM